MISFFELGSCHHDFYLVNIRISVDEMRDLNMHIPGRSNDVWLTVSVIGYCVDYGIWGINP